MGFDAEAKAPGKILWLGGYSVLERPNIGFVTTVNAYVHAGVKSLDDGMLEIRAPQLGAAAHGRVDPDTGFLSVAAPKGLILLKTSVEVAMRYVACKGIRLKGLSIETRNDPAFSYAVHAGKIAKSGLGSSAAVSVASIAAVLKAYNVSLSEDDALHKLAQTAHSIATGKIGSGFDIAAAVHGSIIYTRYSPGVLKGFPAAYSNEDLRLLISRKWDYKIEKLALPMAFSLSFANFLGEGMVTTAAIGSVSEFKEKEPGRYMELIGKINSENEGAVNALRNLANGKDEENNLALFKSAFERGRLLTKQLGILSHISIEDDDMTKLIEESTSNGAFVAKLPGAGGRDSIAALSLNGNAGKLVEFWRTRKGMEVLGIEIVNEGVIY
ncbi:MAG: hypothetical protein M1611_01655 [Candidatus Marsarchaeota archaeon]|nr:hypothetical protein [Candidatus Marsarchaeota archaeon]